MYKKFLLILKTYNYEKIIFIFPKLH